MSRLDDVQAAHDDVGDGPTPYGSLLVEHAAVPGLVAIARAAQVFTWRQGDWDGPEEIATEYGCLCAALAEFEAGRETA